MTVEALDLSRLGDEPDLAVAFRHIGRICVLTLHGDLHATSVAVLEAQFDRLGRTTCHRVVVDLSGLASIDATGAKVLTGLRHYVAARGGRFSIVGACERVASALGADAVP